MGFSIEDVKVGDRDVAAAQGSSVGQVKMSDEASWVELNAETLLAVLKPYAQKKAAAKDLIAKSVLIKADGENVHLRAFDGTSFLMTSFKARANKFPASLVVDLDALHKVCQFASKVFYMEWKADGLYMVFGGGEVFIPTYEIDRSESIFECVIDEKEFYQAAIPAESYWMALTCLRPIVDSSSIPDLSFLFVRKDGVFASNGVSVGKVLGAYSPCVLRDKDADTVTILLEQYLKETVYLMEFSKYYQLSMKAGSVSASYIFPKANLEVTEELLAYIQRHDREYFVEVPMFAKVLDLFAGMPDNTGVVELGFGGHHLVCETLSKRGNKSSFVLSTSVKGEYANENVRVSMRGLATALKMFKDDAVVVLAYDGSNLQIYSGSKHQTIFLRS